MTRKDIPPQISLKPGLHQVQVPLTKIIPIQHFVRMSQAELAQEVEKALHNNPFLEKGPSDQGEENWSPSDILISKEETVYTKISEKSRKKTDQEKNFLEEMIPDRETSLTGDLLRQLTWFDLSDQDREIASGIISLTNQQGYVNPDQVRELADKKFLDDYFRVWDLLKKKLDPPGVVCEDIRDSLAVQLLRLGYEEGDLSVKMVRSHFDDLLKKKVSILSKSLGATLRDVRAAARVIHALDPYPLRNRRTEEFDNSLIVPDVVVRSREDRLEVSMNHEMIPQVRLLKGLFKELIVSTRRKKTATENEGEWQKKKEEAEILVNALNYRESNLKKVVDHLIEKQRDFFIKGFSELKPYRLTDLSKDLGIDKGSLSRLVNSKYVATNWGCFRLRDMFSLPVEVNGNKVSPKLIQEKIKTLIEEFYEQKLTDKKIAMILKEMGYPIARRTVNKYRKRIV